MLCHINQITIDNTDIHIIILIKIQGTTQKCQRQLNVSSAGNYFELSTKVNLHLKTCNALYFILKKSAIPNSNHFKQTGQVN